MGLMLEKALQKPKVILISVWLLYCVLFLGGNVNDDGSYIDQSGIIIDTIITMLFVLGLVWMAVRNKEMKS